MKYPAYPKYKDSGVAWLGGVPEHWDLKAIKWETSVQRGASPRPIDDPQYFDDEGEYAWVRISDVTEAGMYLENTEQRLSDIGSSLSVKLEPGSLFLSIAATVGKPCITQIKCCIHDGFVYFPHWNGNSKFLFYIFASGEPYKGLGKMGTQLNLNTDTVGSIIIGLPDKDEQTAIANFLDRETGRLDALIEKERKLIALLEEKRSALISRTVTRGLPADVAKEYGLELHTQFKDSGVAWLGEIPEAWEALPLKHACQNLDYRRTPISGEERAGMEKNYPYYGASGIIDQVEDFIFDETLILVAEDGANLLSRSTPLAFLASGKYWVNNHAHILKPMFGDVRYWVGVLQTFDYTPLITGAAQPKLTSDRLGSIFVPMPPDEEQTAIADYLDRETARLDQLKVKVELAIERLQEYRSALITAAVTGKIDVRLAA